MKSLRQIVSGVLLLFGFGQMTIAQDEVSKKNDAQRIIGRWDISVGEGPSAHPAWLEISRSGYRTLTGSYVGQFGSARPVSLVQFNDGKFQFTIPPQWEQRQTMITVTGGVDGDGLRGETTNDMGKRVTWKAQRAPSLARRGDMTSGTPVELFNGKDLSGWKARNPNVKNGWRVRDNVLANDEPGTDLLTEQLFTDFKLEAQFRYPRGSNSGIYLRGRYELQVEDNFGGEPDSHRIGGIYGFLTPSSNAAKPADEWQSVQIRLIGRQVTVVLNGERIIDRQSIPGITGGALDSNEGQPGPIMLQGDHGRVEFRNLILTPLEESPRKD